MIDLGCLVLIALHGLLGWRRGLLLSLLALGGVAAGYVAAYLLYAPLGRALGPALGLQPLLAYPVGGLVAFVGTSLLLGIVRFVLRRRERSRNRAGRVAGALIGVAHGAAICLLVTWALLALQALAPGRAPDARGSIAGRIAAPLWSALARRVAGRASGSDAVAEAAGRFARDPLQSSNHLGAVLGHERVQQLLSDRRALRELARSGDAGAEARRATVRKLAADRELVQAAHRAGLLRVPADGLTAEEKERQLAQQLAPVARAIVTLRKDPEVRRLLADRELVERISRRDLLALANDPRFNQLAALVVEHVRRAQARTD
jgi:hypothetical protein